VLPGWFPIAAAYAARLDEKLPEILRAFGQEGREYGDADAFGSLEGEARGRVPGLPDAIVGALDEVDEAQARLFARRFSGVYEILGTLEGPEARVYRVALVARLLEILAAPRPRALRVRALCDYYYSHAALLHHRGPGATLEQLLDASPWRTLQSGLSYSKVEGSSELGPVHLNLLRLRGGRIRSVDARGQDFSQLVQSSGAGAGVSGGFFLYSEPDIASPSERGDPVGMLFDGRLRPPAFRRATLMQRGGRFEIDRVGLPQLQVRVGSRSFAVSATNDSAQLGTSLVAFNRAWGRRLLWPHAVAVVDDRVVALAGEHGVAVPLAGFVLAFPEASAVPPMGTRLHYELPGPALEAAMAGGPMLLGDDPMQLESEDFAGSAPPVTFSRDETFDQNLLPRMGVGLTAEGELVFCAVDGRNFERAPGFTLGMTARALRALGCVRAMNLDGGSSKRMVVAGEVVDLPSTDFVHGGSKDAGLRPVRSGILLFGES
jgi:hypothetical protein